jgi:GNAT superfamily N-acetyltransferase
MERLRIADRGDEELLDAFHAGLYLDAFAHQREPLEVWKRRLWSGEPPPYQLCIELAGERLRDPAARRLDGGIVFERYPASRCGLVTYLVVAPHARGRGLGRRLLAEAVAGLDVRHVLGEVSAPHDEASWRRLGRFQRWGARVVDAPYVQPALGPGLARDRGLRLIVFPGARPLPPAIPAAELVAFLDELFAITEGAPPADAEYAALRSALTEDLALVELGRRQ